MKQIIHHNLDLMATNLSPNQIKEIKNKKLPNLEVINAYPAMELSDGYGVKIGIINSGIDFNHDELKSCFGNKSKGINYIWWAFDKQGNTRYDEKGKRVFDENYEIEYPMDQRGHGTAIAGIIGSKSIGIAPKSSLFSIKISDKNGSVNREDLEAAIRYCISNNIDIVNISISLSHEDSLEKLCNEVYNKGIILVSSAGNYNSGAVFPSVYDSVISVTSVNNNKKHTPWANVWPTVNISAPGQDIFTTDIKREGGYKQAYCKGKGTSFAAPHISGTLALGLSLLKRYDVTYNHRDVINELYSSCFKPKQEDDILKEMIILQKFDKINPKLDVETFYKYVYGAGIVDAQKFIDNLKAHYLKNKSL